MNTHYLIHCKREHVANRIFIDNVEIKPGLSQKLRNHSPDGFNWGYGGSGPAQAALAICLHIFDSPAVAQALYQEFKWKFVSTWGEDEFSVHLDLTDFILDHWQYLKTLSKK
jgi:hypothetical protein